jgi:hypothetical protein
MDGRTDVCGVLSGFELKIKRFEFRLQDPLLVAGIGTNSLAALLSSLRAFLFLFRILDQNFNTTRPSHPTLVNHTCQGMNSLENCIYFDWTFSARIPKSIHDSASID